MIELDEGEESGEGVAENAGNVVVFGGDMEILWYAQNSITTTTMADIFRKRPYLNLQLIISC